MEAFSDGVVAIIITIMVLELKAPPGTSLAALQPLVPLFMSYVLSFVFVGIYWNNHHHLLQASRHVTGPVLWANLHLLFWMSLFPLCTTWMGETHFAAWPVAVYGSVLFLAGCAYFILTRALIACHDENSTLARAVGRDTKGWLSIVLYAVAIPSSFYRTWFALLIYVVVAVMWLIPDRRIERTIRESAK